jgi:FAD/FMN-containing dehydrogenase
VRVYDGGEARAHLGADLCRGDQAVLVVATAGPTDLAAVDRDLVRSAANAMAGRHLGPGPAELWWRRRTGHDPGPEPLPPALQVAAAPSKQVAVYAAAVAAATGAGAAARAHASRFDADGAVLFFTLTDRDGDTPLAAARLAEVAGAVSAAAAAAGGCLLGSPNPALSPYLRALRDALDPHRLMNPTALSA